MLRPLRVALFSTGDELLEPGQPPREGAIYDSNRFTLLALLARLGCETRDLGRIADQPEALEAALCSAAAEVDVVITSGGVSQGDADHLRTVLRRLGETHRVPVAFTIDGQPATALAGETLFSITNIPNVRSHIEAGKLRGLATTAAKRSSAFPNLPTMRESGYPQFDLTGWIGIFAPAGTPAAIVEKLNAAYVKAMQDPELKKRLIEQGDEVATGSVAAFTSFVAKSDEQWGKIATSANVKID